MTIRIGLIGAGNISATHARAVEALPDGRVVAVYSPTLERARRLAATCGAVPHDSLERFFDSASMDMVVIGTPSGLHGEHGSAAAGRGLHVLVEKPLEISTARADALIDAASQAGVTLGVIFQDRVKPDVLTLKSLVEAGTLGRPITASARVPWWRPPEYYHESRWRGTWALDGGGALMNQGIHTVDLLLWLFGSMTRVWGRTATSLHAIEVEDTAVATVDFAGGAFGTIEATTCAFPGRPRRLELIGSNGTAILEGDRLIAVDLQSGRSDVAPAGVRPESAASPAVSDPSAHRDVLLDFIRAFTSGTPPLCDGREGRRSIELVEAIYRSARTGSPVTL